MYMENPTNNDLMPGDKGDDKLPNLSGQVGISIIVGGVSLGTLLTFLHPLTGIIVVVTAVLVGAKIWSVDNDFIDLFDYTPNNKPASIVPLPIEPTAIPPTQMTDKMPFELAGPSVFPVSGDGKYGYDIVGESYCTEAIVGLVGSPGSERGLLAKLVPEPSNEYDRNAIRVEINDRHVGYIPGEDTGDWGILIEAAKSKNKEVGVKASVWSRIFLIGPGPDSRQSGYVSLDTPKDIRLAIPLNDLPLKASSLLPGKRHQQVKTGSFPEPVEDILTTPGFSGKAGIYLEISTTAEKQAKIMFNGFQIGELSEYMTQKMEPLICKARIMDKPLYAMGIAKGNSLEFKLSINLPDISELSEKQIQNIFKA